MDALRHGLRRGLVGFVTRSRDQRFACVGASRTLASCLPATSPANGVSAKTGDRDGYYENQTATRPRQSGRVVGNVRLGRDQHFTRVGYSEATSSCLLLPMNQRARATPPRARNGRTRSPTFVHILEEVLVAWSILSGTSILRPWGVRQLLFHVHLPTTLPLLMNQRAKWTCGRRRSITRTSPT